MQELYPRQESLSPQELFILQAQLKNSGSAWLRSSRLRMLTKVLESRIEKSIGVSVYRFLPDFECDLLCKFHDAKFSMNLDPCVFLSSFDYFRKYSLNKTNMLDVEEGSFDPQSSSFHSGDSGSFDYDYSPPREIRRKVKFDKNIEHILYSNPGWIWCLNIPPKNPSSAAWKSIKEEFLDEGKGRYIFFPFRTFDELCMEIGKQVGLKSVGWRDWKSYYGRVPLIWHSRKILVIHGPMLYRKNKHSFISMFDSPPTRALVSCFVKDIRFSLQREYRVLVCGFSSPSRDKENVIVDYVGNRDIEKFVGVVFDNARNGKLEGGVVYEGYDETLLKQLAFCLAEDVE